jgi:hypothetical protein
MFKVSLKYQIKHIPKYQLRCICYNKNKDTINQFKMTQFYHVIHIYGLPKIKKKFKNVIIKATPLCKGF